MILHYKSSSTAVKEMRYELVEELPEDGESGVVYLLPAQTKARTSSNTQYDEYVLTNGVYQKIGTAEIDFSQYWSKAELVPMPIERLREVLV